MNALKKYKSDKSYFISLDTNPFYGPESRNSNKGIIIMKNIFSKYAFIGNYRIEITILNKKGRYSSYIIHLDNVNEIVETGFKLEKDFKKNQVQIRILQTKPYLFLAETQMEIKSMRELEKEIDKLISEIIIRKLVKEI